MTLRDDVFNTVATIDTVGDRNDQAIVDELIARGYDPLRRIIGCVRPYGSSPSGDWAVGFGFTNPFVR